MTGESWIYTNWAPGQPNDASGNQDKLHFWPYDNPSGCWDDEHDTGWEEHLIPGYMVEAGGGYSVGDLNCDGVVDNFDIDPFVLALTSAGHPIACDDYEAMYPACDCTLADVNGDGSVNNFDIDPVVELLTGG